MKKSPLFIFAEKRYPRRKIKSFFWLGTLYLSAMLAVGFLAAVFGYVVMKGIPGIKLSFLTELPKPVGEVGGGMANALWGSFELVFFASLMGILWGVMVGVYLSEYSRDKFASSVRFATELLSSVPSIVIGVFVYVILVRPLKTFSTLAGSVALAILMVPTIARTTEEILKMMPILYREAGLALGIPRWKVILRIVVQGSLPGIATGVILAIARAAGETAPLLFTALNNRFWQYSLFEPIASLPVQIYTYAISPFEEWHTQAWAGALLLVFLVFVLNLATRILLSRRGGSRA